MCVYLFDCAWYECFNSAHQLDMQTFRKFFFKCIPKYIRVLMCVQIQITLSVRSSSGDFFFILIIKENGLTSTCPVLHCVAFRDVTSPLCHSIFLLIVWSTKIQNVQYFQTILCTLVLKLYNFYLQIEQVTSLKLRLFKPRRKCLLSNTISKKILNFLHYN